MKDKSKCPTCCSEVNYHVEGGTSYYTPVDIKEMIEQAHMAGQIDAGVDPGYSNAQEYARKALNPDSED